MKTCIVVSTGFPIQGSRTFIQADGIRRGPASTASVIWFHCANHQQPSHPNWKASKECRKNYWRWCSPVAIGSTNQGIGRKKWAACHFTPSGATNKANSKASLKKSWILELTIDPPAYRRSRCFNQCLSRWPFVEYPNTFFCVRFIVVFMSVPMCVFIPSFLWRFPSFLFFFQVARR